MLVAIAAAIYSIVWSDSSVNLTPQQVDAIGKASDDLDSGQSHPPRTQTIPGVGVAHFLYGAGSSPNESWGPGSIRGGSSRAVLFVYRCTGAAGIQTNAHFNFGFMRHVANDGHLLHSVSYHLSCTPGEGKLWHRLLIYPFNANGQRLYPRGDYRFGVQPAVDGAFWVNVYLVPPL